VCRTQNTCAGRIRLGELVNSAVHPTLYSLLASLPGPRAIGVAVLMPEIASGAEVAGTP
jgi:hypothetical protein